MKELDELKKKQDTSKNLQLVSPRGQEVVIQNLKKELDEFREMHLHILAKHKAEVEQLNKEIAELKSSGAHKSVELTHSPTDQKVDSKVESGSFEFTTCGVTGRVGPTQTMVNFTYKNGPLKNTVTSKNGIQVWKVAKTGDYRLKAFGSQGGKINNGQKLPGCGAVMQGDFHFTEGQEIQVICGQEPAAPGGSIGGGGGGTFVCDSSNNPLLIAGGGGGASFKHEVKEVMHGTKEQKGGGEFGGTEGRGGYAIQGKTGGGGGGLKSDGTNGTGGGGKAFVNGGMGGEEDTKAAGRTCSHGAFGGGGGGEFSETGSSGGGGGYGGGSPGSEDCGPAGGGGSFNGGKNQVNLNGSESYRGPGKVIITPL